MAEGIPKFITVPYGGPAFLERGLTQWHTLADGTMLMAHYTRVEWEETEARYELEEIEVDRQEWEDDPEING